MLPSKYLKSTELDDEVRHNHDECGDKRGRLYVRRTINGWVFHCHNCGDNGFQRAKSLPPSETLKMLEGKGPGKQFILPRDMTDDLPIAGRLWLERYGITDEEVAQYQIKYSKDLKRLILPVMKDGEWVGWQGRAIKKGQQPKYLSSMKGSVVFTTNLSKDTLILVEDILSAIKCGREHGSIALLGSFIPTSLVPMIENKRILIWLDADKQIEAMHYARRFKAVHGLDCQTIHTKLDPKAYSTEEIRRLCQLN